LLSRVISVRLEVAITALVISALLGGQRGFAEDSTRLAGVVFTTAQGDRAVVPGAHVRLTTANGVRETLTDAKGAFTFADVPPGSYSVEATSTGLRGAVTAIISSD
jgi:hypothetical protein